MAETKRKTLRDYVLEGGIKGRFFHATNLVIEGIYEVLSCSKGLEKLGDGLVYSSYILIKYIHMGEDNEFDEPFGRCFLDPEATLEEVQRAKEIPEGYIPLCPDVSTQQLNHL